MTIGTQATIGIMAILLGASFGVMLFITLLVGFSRVVSTDKTKTVTLPNGDEVTAFKDIEQLTQQINLDLTPYRSFVNCLMKDTTGKYYLFDNLIVSPAGVFIVSYLEHKGLITGTDQDPYWAESLEGQQRTFANPVHQNLERMQLVESIIGGVPLYSVICFTNNPILQATSQQAYLVKANQISPLIAENQQVLSNQQIDQIYTKLHGFILRGSKHEKAYLGQLTGKAD